MFWQFFFEIVNVCWWMQAETGYVSTWAHRAKAARAASNVTCCPIAHAWVVGCTSVLK